MSTDDLAAEVTAAAQAIGLLNGDGGLDPHWFEHPLSALAAVLTNADQRAAVLRLLDAVAPAAQVPGVPAGEVWHPLLRSASVGNGYLTVNHDDAGRLTLGLAGRLAPGGAPPTGALEIHLPVVRGTATGLDAIAGTSDGPLVVAARLELGWHAPADDFTLAAVRARLEVVPFATGGPTAQFAVTLEGLDLDGHGAHDVELDASNLGNEAVHVILAILRHRLRGIGGAVAHLLPLFGLGDDTIPPFPVVEIASEGLVALERWVLALLDDTSGTAPIAAWLTHFAALFGGTAAATSDGAAGWRVPLVAFGAGDSGLALQVARRVGAGSAPELAIGIAVTFVPAGSNPIARVEAAATLAQVPLGATARAAILPDASITLTAPGALDGSLLDSGPITVGAFRAGLAWDGSTVRPLLEIDRVRLTPPGTSYDRIDLTDAGSVAAAARDAAGAALSAALGATGPGAHLAALIGLVPPAGGAWAHSVDLAQLFSNPARAIAAVHRGALADGSWGRLFGELTALFGITAATMGTGTSLDPYRVPLLGTGPLALELAAWDAESSTASDATRKLRFGLRAEAASAPWSASWTSELLAIDLPATGSGALRLLAGQHVAFELSPIATLPSVAGVTLAANAVAVTFDWTPGGHLTGAAVIDSASVTIDGHAYPLGPLSYPPPAGGISFATIAAPLRALLGRAARSWGGAEGYAVAALLGLHNDLPGLPADWPRLGEGASGWDLAHAPREWIARLATAVSSDGAPVLPRGLAWLAALLAARPIDTTAPPQLAGTGTPDDPWSFPLGSVDGLAWLEPAGPPAAWLVPARAAVAAARSYGALLSAMRQAQPFVAAFAAARPEIVGALADLDSFLTASDGVVPVDAQLPTGGTWQSGTPLAAAHPDQPGDAQAIAQIRAQLTKWATIDGSAPTVVLLGPAFSDHTIWDPLLTALSATAARVDFRVAGVDPAAVDLSGLAHAGYYTIDLHDDGSNDVASLNAQIRRVLDRLSGVRVALVAHSTAGVAARLAASHPSVRGLITVGTPHGTTPLEPLRDGDMATGVRALGALFAGGLGDDALGHAIAHLQTALDGFRAGAAGALPAPAPYPVHDFDGATGAATIAVDALALGGPVGAGLFARVQSLALAAIDAAAAHTAPTHLAFGARAHLGVPNAGAVSVDAFAQAALLRVALVDGGPPAPPRNLRLRVALERPDDWLVGAAGPSVTGASGDANVRVRAAEIGLDLELAGSAVHATPVARLIDAAWYGPLTAEIKLGDASASALFGAVFSELASAPANTGAATLLALLQAIDLATPDGLAADGLAALVADPLPFLAPRAPALLAAAGPSLGFATDGTTWTRAIGGLPFELVLAPDGVGLRTTDTGFAVGSAVALTFDTRVTLPSLDATFDATLALGRARLSFASATATLTLAASPWIDALTLRPAPSSADLQSALERAAPRLLLSAAASWLIESVVGPDFPILPIDALLDGPARPFSRDSASGGGLDATAISRMLDAVSRALGNPTGGPLALPLGLALSVSGTDTVRFTLATTTPILSLVDISLSLDVDRHFAVTPSGTLTLHIKPSGSWPSLDVTFGATESGLTLVLTPGGSTPIHILPTFDGADALIGSLEALLPSVLDKLVGALPSSPVLDAALGVATALGVYDASGGFAAHTDALRALARGDFLRTFGGPRAPIVSGLAALFGASGPLAGILPTGATVSTTPDNALELRYPLSGTASGAVALTVGWDSAGPTLLVGTESVRVGGGLVSIDAQAGYADGAIAAALDLGVDFSTLGVSVMPRVVASAGTAGFTFALLPLGAATSAPFSTTGPLAIQLAPTFAVAPVDPLALITGWVLPLTIDFGLAVAAPYLATPIWTGGPTLQAVLQSALLVDGSGHRASPLPALDALAAGLVGGLATGATVPITDHLHIELARDGSRIGVRLRGYEEFDAGSVGVRLLFGEPAAFLSDANRGITVYLFDNASGSLKFRPAVRLLGVGVGLEGGGGHPLVDTANFRMGSVDAYLFVDVELTDDSGAPAVAAEDFGAGVEIGGLGLPLGQASGASTNNAVAASLMSHTGGTSGDHQPVNPSLGLAVWYRNPSEGIRAKFEGEDGPIWIGVHSAFGPLYIDQIGIGLSHDDTNGDGVDVMIDGSVRVSGLTVQVDELGVTVPFHYVLSPGHWTLDLRALAVGYSGSSVSIAGGLLKNPGPPLEYDGVVTVDVAGRGFTAVGSYAQLDDYTSIFIFASLPITIGGPPFLFVTGLGGGFGYNRELIPPTNIDDVPNFFLVEAIDDDRLSADPMGALKQMAGTVPPKRGSLWMAAGVRFTSYVIVHTTAVVYVALDRGFEVGLLGVSRMQLPSDDTTLVSVELALQARYSTVDRTLLIRAQLTDNSWLFSHDCRLTGGFAFFIWFDDAQFVLTLGGYNPAFQRPDKFPDVPRLGFEWTYSPVIHLKGAAYFALTNSCVMAGGSLEVTYGVDGINVWFSAAADFLVSWDPFHYDIRVSISVGARFTIRPCCFGVCVTIHVSVSLGASLHISGPALHGDVTVDLDIASITVSFGSDDPPAPQYMTDFEMQFAPKYLVGADPDLNWVSAHVSDGLLPPDPPGAQPAPGSADQPWKIRAEFAFSTETRMPGATYQMQGVMASPASATGVAPFDLAAMGPEHANVASLHIVAIETPAGAPVVPVAGTITVEQTLGLVPEASWHFIAPENQRAAANTLPALVGVTVRATAVLEGKSDDIPIATLVVDLERYAQPLPFAALTAGTRNGLLTLGAAAKALAAEAQPLALRDPVGAAQRVTGSSEYVARRSQLGLPPAGPGPLAIASLATRSAPPMFTSVAEGLTLEPVGLAAPPVVVRWSEAPVALAAPRLRASLSQPMTPTSDAPAAARTSVSTIVATKGLARVAPPQPATVMGARLERLPSPNAPRATRAAVVPRALRTTETGNALSRSQRTAFAAAEKALIGDGIQVAPGTTLVWDVPPGYAQAEIDGVARVTFLDAAGRLLQDSEVPAKASVALPADTRALVLSALGTPAGGTLQQAAGPGAVTSVAAPAGATVAVGWQSASHVVQVGPSLLLARGAAVVLAHPATVARGPRATHNAVVRAAEIIGEQSAVETWLPIGTEVVVVLLDCQDATASDDGDLAIAVEGATLSSPPERATGGRRRALVYDVVSRDAKAQQLIVSVASRSAFRFAGCVGLSGRAADWAARWAGGVPEQLVPDGPLTPTGHATVRLIHQQQPGEIR
jgi:hypothetical protein